MSLPSAIVNQGTEWDTAFSYTWGEGLGGLGVVVDRVYREASKRLLDVLLAPTCFPMHLEAIRGYLLFGQGDFIQTLLPLLKYPLVLHPPQVPLKHVGDRPELDQPSGMISLHSLTAHLESAIRLSNAQYDNPQVLACLDVRLFAASWARTRGGGGGLQPCRGTTIGSVGTCSPWTTRWRIPLMP